MTKFIPLIYFDESEYCDSYVDEETLVIIADVEGVHFKDKLLIPKERDDTG